MYGESEIAVICKNPRIKECFSSYIQPSLQTLSLSLSLPSANSNALQNHSAYIQNSFSYFDSVVGLGQAPLGHVRKFRVIFFVFYAAFSDTESIKEALEASRVLPNSKGAFLLLFLTDLIPSSESQFKKERENFEKVTRILINSDYNGPILKLLNWASEKRVKHLL
jgi:hypothetical protein